MKQKFEELLWRTEKYRIPNFEVGYWVFDIIINLKVSLSSLLKPAI